MTASSSRALSSNGLDARFSLRSALLACAAATSLAFMTAGQPAHAQCADAVIAKVNGAEIRQSDLVVAEEELGPSLQQLDPASRRESLISFLIDMKIVAKAAEDKKLGDTAAFKQRLTFARNRLLMDSILADEGKAAVSDDAMKKVYEEATKQTSG